MIDIDSDIQSRDEACISISGEIDMETSDELRKVLMDAVDQQMHTITVDMGNVDFIDSSGIATLVETLQQVKKYDGTLVLKNMRENVQSVFEIANLMEVFTIE